MERQFPSRGQSSLRWLIFVIVGVVVLAIVFGLLSSHFYLFVRVDPQEVAVRFRGGRVYQVVGPGVYSDVAWFADIERVSTAAVTFSVSDPEVVTSDRQRVGFAVSGDVFRPNISEAEVLRELWGKYRVLYLNDAALNARVTDLALQALKSCVGDRTFNDNVIGSARDELVVCIDTELGGIASALGLDIKNVAIPIS